jgi:hypothetical protein
MARKKTKQVHRNDYPEPYYYAPEKLSEKEREKLTLLNLLLRADKNRKDKFVRFNACNSEMYRDSCIKERIPKISIALKRAGFIRSCKLKDEYIQIGNDCVHKFEDTGKKKFLVQIYEMEKGPNYKRSLTLIKEKCLPYLSSTPSIEWPYFYANFEKGQVFHEKGKFKPKLKGYKMELLKAFIKAGANGLSNEDILKICKLTARIPKNGTETHEKRWLKETVRKSLDDFKAEWGMTNLKRPLFEQIEGGYRFILPQQYIRKTT